MTLTRCTLAIALALGAALTLACDEESGEEKVDGIVEDYVATINRQVDIICDCYEELGHESRADCKEERGEILPAKQRCYEDALAQDVDATEQWADCVLPLESEYEDCVDSKLECDDLASSQPCSDDYMVGLKNCIALPQSVQRDIDDCNA